MEPAEIAGWLEAVSSWETTFLRSLLYAGVPEYLPEVESAESISFEHIRLAVEKSLAADPAGERVPPSSVRAAAAAINQRRLHHLALTLDRKTQRLAEGVAQHIHSEEDKHRPDVLAARPERAAELSEFSAQLNRLSSALRSSGTVLACQGPRTGTLLTPKQSEFCAALDSVERQLRDCFLAFGKREDLDGWIDTLHHCIGTLKEGNFCCCAAVRGRLRELLAWMEEAVGNVKKLGNLSENDRLSDAVRECDELIEWETQLPSVRTWIADQCRLGRYTITERISEREPQYGRPFVEVVQAELVDGTKVAVKVFGEVRKSYHTRVESLEREFKMVFELDSPYLVTYYAFVEHPKEETCRLFMEYLPVPLTASLYTGSPEREKLLRSHVRDVCQGLLYLHSRIREGVIFHRDIKPHNVMLTGFPPEGRAKLIDFGISKQVPREDIGKHSAWVGTPYFAAPEMQLTREEYNADQERRLDYDHKVDVWALGISICFLAGDSPPWPSRLTPQDRESELIAHIKNTPPLLPTTLSPVALDFITLCLKWAPKERASVAALLEHSWLRECSSS